MINRKIENPTIGKLIFNAAIFSLYGWFIFVGFEIIIRWIKRPSPWPFMILFTLLFYSGVGIAMGGVLGGVIGFLLRVVKRWQQRIDAIPLIMSCCFTLIILFYTSIFIHDRFYPHLPYVPINLSVSIFSLILLCTVYVIPSRVVDKTRLITSYLTLTIVLYAFVIVGRYINESLLSGKFFDLDAIRVITNSGILISSVIFYVATEESLRALGYIQ